jgi:hypothetical protein
MAADTAETIAAYRSTRRHRTTRAFRHESAKVALDGIEPGVEIVCLTYGQFSLIDAITVLLEQTGPADVTISTWSAAHADLEHARTFLDNGLIRSIRFAVDRSFVNRQPEYCRSLVKIYGPDCIRSTRLHSKFVIIRNDRWNIAVRTSMNLNENPRLELIEVSDDPGLAGFLQAEVDRLFAQQPPGVFAGDLDALDPADAATPLQLGMVVSVGPQD